MSLPNIPQSINAGFILEENKLTSIQKLKFVFTHITVEPIVLFFVIAWNIKFLTSQNLWLEKACRVNLNYNSSTCHAMVMRNATGFEPFQEIQVQQLVSKMVAIRSICMGSLPAILMLFIGSWSDRHGRRKPVIMMPILGEVIGCFLLFVCVYYFSDVSLEYTALSEIIPNSLTGGWFTAFLGFFSYVSAFGDDENKTIRMGAVSVCENIGTTIGVFLIGFLVKALGFIWMYAISLAMYVTAIIYGHFMLKENRIVHGEEKKNAIKDFFDFDNVKRTFEICFKEGPQNRKWKMVILMFIDMMLVGPLCGEINVLYLYTILRFSWTELDFSIFFSINYILQILGSIFGVPFFSKYLKLDDAMLGVVGLIGKIVSYFIYAFATSTFHFYAGAVIEIFYAISYIALRSLMAKIVAPHELGQSNSVFGICEAIMPLVFGPFYTTLYYYTIGVFPGTFFLTSAVLRILAMGLFLWIYRESRKESWLRKEIEINIQQEENLLKKACFNEMKKSMEKLKSAQSLSHL
ncbi:hypothetical protein HHI36_003467 [Cryptolaemus montrouzieri]|uniref:Solute carrier family 46 member 3 n=1 Tax=Cryptolaemus montrouzieri TaxID=559131 RepID=A0ABD2PDH0_9CUCU